MISEKVGLVVDQVRMAIRVLDGAKKLKFSLEKPEHQLSGKDCEAGESQEDVGEDAQCLVVGVRLPRVVEDDAKVGEVVAKADSLGWIGLFSGKSTASGRPSVLSKVPPNTGSLIHRILDRERIIG